MRSLFGLDISYSCNSVGFDGTYPITAAAFDLDGSFQIYTSAIDLDGTYAILTATFDWDTHNAFYQ